MKALIVVDMQNDFCKSGGALYNPAAESIILNICTLIDSALACGDSIYFTRDTHYFEDYLETQEGKNLPIEHCIYGTEGWRVVNELDINSSFNNAVFHLDKTQFGYDYWDDFKELKQADEIIVCGTITSICVLTNVALLKTYFPEVPIKVYANCVADITPERQAAALECMRAMQVEVIE